MSLLQVSLGYLITILFILVIDGAWFRCVSKDFYKKQLGSLLIKKINFVAAATTYLVLAVGLIYFAVFPSLQIANYGHALRAGLLFGFVIYSIYDLTNQATIKGWSSELSIIDITWGTFLCGITSVSSYFFFEFIKIYF